MGKLLSGLGVGKGPQDTDLMRQAENIWKMLDDLSENNPDGYQQFISSNISQGKEAIRKEREEEMQAYTRPLLKNDFVVTLKVDFLLKPKVDVNDLKAPTSVLINKKSLKSYKGSLLLSFFAIKEQKPDLPPSVDRFSLRFNIKEDVCCSALAALHPSSAKGLVQTPMEESSRRDMSRALSIVQHKFPREAKKYLLQNKLDLEYDPEFHNFEFLPATLGKLKGYLDCEGKTEIPKSIVLESVMAADKTKASEENKKPPEPERKIETKDTIPPLAKKEPEIAKPKIEVIAEATDFASMIRSKIATPEKVEISIELEEVEAMAEVDLDISKTCIKIANGKSKR